MSPLESLDWPPLALLADASSELARRGEVEATVAAVELVEGEIVNEIARDAAEDALLTAARV